MRSRQLKYGVVLFVALFALWEFIGRSKLVDYLVLPLPSSIILAIPNLVTSDRFLTNLFLTLSTWLLSLVLGLIFGLMLGFVSALDIRLNYLFNPILGFFRSIPPIALFPISLIAIGPGAIAIGVVATFGACLYVFPGTATASRQTSERYTELAHILGCSRWQFLTRFVAPGAILHIVASSRVAATYSFAVCVAGEMIIGGRTGIGAAILDYSERFKLEEAYAYILLTGIVGVLIDLLFQSTTRIAQTKQLSNFAKQG